MLYNIYIYHIYIIYISYIYLYLYLIYIYRYIYNIYADRGMEICISTSGFSPEGTSQRHGQEKTPG